MAKGVRWQYLAMALAGAAVLAPPPASAQDATDLVRMLRDAEKYTVRIRATVNWPMPPEQFGSGQGTGFIIDRARGWIMTNAHVAKRSPSVVEIAQGEGESEWVPVEKHFVDNLLDVAILRVDPARLPAEAGEARLGCEHQVRQGAGVVAYGHPVNLTFTATRGIVSSLRNLDHHEFIQLDAMINPGNSGGPLLAVEVGQVIGINTANIPGAPGLGFATPIRHICPILDLLKEGREAAAPTLPFYWLKSGRVETLTIGAPFSNVPQAAALRAGDQVLGFANGPRINTVPDLLTALRGRSGVVELSVRRDGAVTTVSVPLIPAAAPMRREGLILNGMLIVERSAVDIDYRNDPRLRIEFVRTGETAARAGFMSWDQLDQVGGRRFNNLAELQAWLKERQPRERVQFLVRRNVAVAERRISAEYHRLELSVSDARLVTGADSL